MNFIQYAPTTSFDDKLSALGSEVPESSAIYIFPDIPAISQMEEKYSYKGVWSDKFFTFAKLSSVSTMTCEVIPNHISKLGRLMLMQEVLDELGTRIHVFRDYKDVKGFADSLLGLIAELKHMAITPGYLKELSKTIKTAGLGQKLLDISLVFEAYQEKLRSVNMCDDIDRLHRLAENIRSGRFDYKLSGLTKVVVFGFYDFTQSQLDVLESLDQKVNEVTVLLPQYNELHKLEHRIKSKLQWEESPRETMVIADRERQETRRYINSFPTINHEFDQVFRQIKNLIINENYRFNDIAIVFRNVGGLGQRLINTAEKYGVPVRLDDSLDLGSSIYGFFLDDLIAIEASNYKREELLKFLKNPVISQYLRRSDRSYNVNVIEKLSASSAKAYQGLNNWKNFFNALKESPDNTLSPDTIDRITELLDETYSGFRKLDASELIATLCRILDLIDIRGLSRELINQGSLTSNCWKTFSTFIRELGFISGIFERKFVTIGSFHSFINDLMREKKYSFSSRADGETVKVLEGLKVRGTSYPVIFLLNVDESAFPSPHVSDPVLKLHERKEINSAGQEDIFAEDHIHYEKEEYLFNLICSSALRELYISYSRLDNDYRDKNRSYLVDTMEHCEYEEYGFDDFIHSSQQFCSSDLLASYFYKLGPYEECDEIGSHLAEITGTDLFTYIKNGIKAESERSRLTGHYTKWEGSLSLNYNDKGYYRPTELEVYGTCPFKYFSGNILGLDEPYEIEDRIQPLDLGRLYHEILRDLFSIEIKEYLDQGTKSQLTTDMALEKYFGMIKDGKYDVYFSHLSDAIRELEKKRILAFSLPGFIKNEVERIRKSEFVPSFFEEDVVFEIGGDTIRGKVDRVDRDSNGNVIVYDYKTGSLSSKKYYDFRNLQLPLYLLAFQDRGYNPFGGHYLSIKNRGTEGEEGEDKLQLEDVKSRVASYINHIKSGFFPAVIDDKETDFQFYEYSMGYDFGLGGPCRFCGYSDLCRVKNGVLRKEIDEKE